MRRMILALAFAGLAEVAEATGRGEVPLGLWQTEPDTLGVVLWVRTRACGQALCARVERAKNRRGIDAPSNAVGQQVFWSMRPRPDGAFVGEYRDRAANRFLNARVVVTGNRLRLESCDNSGCRDVEWIRVK